MNAPSVLRTVFVLGLSLWVGAAVFFSGVILPVLFTSLETARAGEIAALLFPYYFRFGAALSVAVFGAALALALRSGGAWRTAAFVAALMLACQAYSTFVLHPRIAEIRESEIARVEFQSLHRRSVRLNAVVLIGGLALVASSVRLLERR